MTKICSILRTLGDIASYLNTDSEIHSFTVLHGVRTHTVYKTDGWYITVKRDSENRTYAVEVRLKAETSLSEIISQAH